MKPAAWLKSSAPQGTPAPTLDLLARESASAVQHADTRARLVDAGFSVVGTSRADTDRMALNMGAIDFQRIQKAAL